MDSRRIKPRRSVGLHAHHADEAVAYGSEPLTIPIEGRRYDGRPAHREVVIPQAFSYTLMKLFAFRDRKDDAESEFVFVAREFAVRQDLNGETAWRGRSPTIKDIPILRYNLDEGEDG